MLLFLALLTFMGSTLVYFGFSSYYCKMMLLLGLIVLTSFLLFSSFLASLHWPQEVLPILGKFGISYFELLINV